MRFLILFAKGLVVGVANVIPGVSGGTLAVVLGIFDELIESVNNCFKHFKKSFIFLLPVLLGAAVGILAFSSLIDYCLRVYSFPTCLFFVGLVTGSIPLIYKKSVSKGFHPKYIVIAALATALVVVISIIKPPSDPQTQTIISAALMMQMFLGGVIAAMAMIVPGISGSSILVLLGLYAPVIRSVSAIKDYLLSPGNFALLANVLMILVPLGIGVLLGIVLISKIMGFLLEKYYSITYFAILGLILGSIFSLFNDPLTYQSYPNGLTVPVIIFAVITFAVGMAMALFLGGNKTKE